MKRKLLAAVVLMCVGVMLVVACPEMRHDRAARATIEDHCIFKAYRSDGTEMPANLELWPDRVVIWENLSDGDARVDFGDHDYFGVASITLRAGESRHTRVKHNAPDGTFSIHITCNEEAYEGEPGSIIGDANPRGEVGDDDGGP